MSSSDTASAYTKEKITKVINETDNREIKHKKN